MLAFVPRREVNVCRPVCAAAEPQFADVAGEFESLLANRLPVRAFVPVACHLVGAARVFLPLVFVAVTPSSGDGPSAFRAGSEWHYAGTGSAARLLSSLACAARPPQLAQAVSMPVGSSVSLSYLKT